MKDNRVPPQKVQPGQVKVWPKFIQIIVGRNDRLIALDAKGDIWIFIETYEMHTGERITAHWASFATMERRP